MTSSIRTTNPATGEMLRDLRAARPTTRSTPASPGPRRRSRTYRTTTFDAAGGVDARRRRPASTTSATTSPRTMTTEMGKTLAVGRGRGGEVRDGDALLRRARRGVPGRRAARRPRARSAPAGRTSATSRSAPVLAVMPWNFPLWQVVRFAAPALMAGNVGLLKHASNVPQTALVPRGRCSRRPGSPRAASRRCSSARRRSRRCCATRGSRRPRSPAASRAGRSVASIAGDEVKKTVLELGGSDPFVVMPSADLDAGGRGRGDRPRARTTASRASPPSGSSCTPTSTTRSPTASSSGMAALAVGDPMDDEHRRRPARHRAGPRRPRGAGRRRGRQGRDGAVRRRRRPDGPGWFYPPTVVADITPEMRIYREEMFGPVATLYRVGRHRRGDRARQRHRRSASARTCGPPTEAEQERFVRRPRRRRGVRQRHDHVVPRAAVRRRQALRLRP